MTALGFALGFIVIVLAQYGYIQLLNRLADRWEVHR
jgi:hypothetical protein